MYVITSIYAASLYLIALTPCYWIYRHFGALIGGTLMFLLMDLCINLVPFSGEGARSFGMDLFFAAIEETARGTCLYIFVSRKGNEVTARALLGATYGWLEFIERVHPTGVKIENALGKAFLMDFWPYLLVGQACAILFHILISMLFYRHATKTVTMITAIMMATIIHAAYNFMLNAAPWHEYLQFRFVVVPSVMIAIMALWSYSALPKTSIQNIVNKGGQRS